LPDATAAQVFDASTPKSLTSVSVNLLRQTRELNVGLSQALEERLIARILRKAATLALAPIPTSIATRALAASRMN